MRHLLAVYLAVLIVGTLAAALCDGFTTWDGSAHGSHRPPRPLGAKRLYRRPSGFCALTAINDVRCHDANLRLENSMRRAADIKKIGYVWLAESGTSKHFGRTKITDVIRYLGSCRGA